MIINKQTFAEIDFKNLKHTHSFLQLKEACYHLSPEHIFYLVRGGKFNQDLLYKDPTNSITTT